MPKRLFVGLLADAIVLITGTTHVMAQDGQPPAMPAQGNGMMINLSDIAEVLNLDEEELRQAIEDGQTIAALAEEQGVSLDDVRDVVLDGVKDRLAEEVVNGNLSEDEAVDILSQTGDQVDDWFENGFPQWGGPGGLREAGMPVQYLEAAATALGLEIDELQAFMREGMTVAEIASESSVSLHDVQVAILEAAEGIFSQDVTEGKMSQDDADERLAQLEENIVDWFENGFPVAGGGPGGMNMFDRYLPDVAELLDMDEDELRQQTMGGSSIAEIADELGISLDDIQTALLADIEEQLAGDIADGKLTQEMADEMLEHFNNNLMDWLEGNFQRGPMGGDVEVFFDSLSEVPGLSMDDLQQARVDGNSIEELAEAQGLTLDEVKDTLIEMQTEWIEEAVTDGEKTQEEADILLDELEERIEQRIKNWTNTAPSGMAS